MTKMKKILAVGLAGVMAVAFAACSNGTTDEGNTDAAAAVKTGYAVSASLGHPSHDEKEDFIEIDTVVAAVLVDADGKVVACQIDEAQTQPNLQENDGFVDEAALRTKKQKLEDYGMKAVSAQAGNIENGGEWYEQIAAFEEWTIGKTADEIAGAAMTEEGAVADLASSCTIYSGGFVGVVTEAIKNATDMGAKSTDTLKLAMSTDKYYESVAGELVQYDTSIAVVTTDAEGKITSCITDATQGKCYVKDGKFTGKDDTTYPEGTFKSKKQLGDEYGMKGVSAGIGAIENGGEWYEQAKAFEDWTIGKTAEEVKAGMGEDGKIADLASSCTITAYGFVGTVAAAATK